MPVVRAQRNSGATVPFASTFLHDGRRVTHHVDITAPVRGLVKAQRVLLARVEQQVDEVDPWSMVV